MRGAHESRCERSEGIGWHYYTTVGAVCGWMAKQPLGDATPTPRRQSDRCVVTIYGYTLPIQQVCGYLLEQLPAQQHTFNKNRWNAYDIAVLNKKTEVLRVFRPLTFQVAVGAGAGDVLVVWVWHRL